MTRATQTLSVALLATSVRAHLATHHFPSLSVFRLLTITLPFASQLYLCLYLELIPLPAIIQSEIVPVVRLSLSPSPSLAPLPSLLSS